MSEWKAVSPQPEYPEHVAPPGTIYVCGACGKTSKDSYNGPGSWDESCMLNAVLCYERDAGAEHVDLDEVERLERQCFPERFTGGESI